MTIKPGAEVQDMHPTLTAALPLLDSMWKGFFPEDVDGATLTSGHEGLPTDPPEARTHGVKSKHYKQNNTSGFGQAVDLRVNDVQQWKASLWVQMAWLTLHINFPHEEWRVFPEDILKENAHIHIQMR